MKRSKILLIYTLTAILILGTDSLAFSQKNKGNGTVVEEERNVAIFDAIKVGGAFNLYLTQGEPQSVIIETDENLLENVNTDVSNSTLSISSDNIKNYTKLNAYITVLDIEFLKASGASTVIGETTITANTLTIEASGASDLKLDLDVENLETELSGASDLELSGIATNHNTDLSGASTLKAYDLQTQNTSVYASGASTASINAINEISTNTSGSSEVRYKNDPEILNITKGEPKTKPRSSSRTIIIESDEWDENVHVKIGGISVDVQEDDTVTVIVGNNQIVVDDDGHVSFNKYRKQKFNGHWAGFALGVNGYVNGSGSLEVPPEYGFLDLKYERCINVQLNLWEQNFNLINNKFGILTGIGFTWLNYHYQSDVTYVPDQPEIYAYYGKLGDQNHEAHPERNYTASKFKVTYLTIPLLLEYQTNRYSRINSFHMTAGMVGGLRLGTKAKVVWNNDGKSKYKQRNDFHMSPFSWNAYAGIGWGWLNLYATYSINTLFRDDRGPELYPWSVGLLLFGW